MHDVGRVRNGGHLAVRYGPVQFAYDGSEHADGVAADDQEGGLGDMPASSSVKCGALATDSPIVPTFSRIIVRVSSMLQRALLASKTIDEEPQGLLLVVVNLPDGRVQPPSRTSCPIWRPRGA